MSHQVPCPHCLEPIDPDFHGDCPHCGKSLDNANPEGALPFGTQLAGKYTVGKYLSADGDGLCYRGVDNEQVRFVRIKEYFPVTLCNGRSPEGALMPKAGREVLFKTSRMDFKDLYDDLRRLTPATGLSRILDVIEENNTVYGVEESEKGMTLTHYLSLKSRPLTPAEARTLLQPVMEGVALLHKSGLIHRGICPDNILLPIDGTAMLTGYGTLALRTGGSELKSQLYAGYAAPEQYSAAEFSGRYTDVYALAAVTYRLVTGQTPVSAPQRRVRDSLESAHSLEAAVPTYFSQVLSCAMRLDPAKRMQTVPELMSALANPNVANAMFETGENQISTKKILGAALVVIFVLAALLLWSLLNPPGSGNGDNSSASDQTTVSSPAPTATPETLTYPNLVGQKLEDVEDSDLYTSFRIVPTEEYSADHEAGIILSQEPEAGTPVEGDTPTIEIVVSKGYPIMPDIIGFTQKKAEEKLEEAGIAQYTMRIVENNTEFATGCVVMCTGENGVRIEAGMPVDPSVIIDVWIAGERDDTAQVSGSSSSSSSSSSQ
ncbi:PASTA domain-containing protein [uncultured Gemmiger sp.]|uniref:protein kinase domain-containing protein n=1 Tax=uncultured Gemmiger sp. TaxID=1623490 RepID=UPI0025F1AFE5|nr:PASTA domain-containing protein [uncultured Gemmiger sp.]